MPRYQKVADLMAAGELGPKLKKLEAEINRLPFTEAPRHLVKQDIITFGGDGSMTGLETFGVVGGGTMLVAGAAVVSPTIWTGIGLAGASIAAPVVGVVLIIVGVVMIAAAIVSWLW